MIKKVFSAKQTTQIRSSFFALLGLIIGLAAISFSERPSWIIFDFMQKFNAPSNQNSVGLVALDQASLDRLEVEGLVFPLPRQIYGAVVEVAKMAQAKAVVFDILFTEPSSYGNDDDQLFANMVQKSGVSVFFPAGSLNGSVKEPILSLKTKAKGLGAANFSAESDGVFRRLPDFLQIPNTEIQTLPQVVYSALGGQPSTSNRSLLTNYSEKSFPNYSLYDILKIYRDLQDGKTPSLDLKDMQNKVWVVGYTAPGLHDLKPMPLNHEAPGMLLHATGIANRFLGHGLSEVRLPIQLGFIFLFVILTVILINQASDPFVATSWLIGFSIVVPSLSLYIFWIYSQWYNPLPALLSILFAGGLQLIWNFQMLWKERLKLAKSLQHSMSPQMLELIRSGEVQISRFGEERHITVLFSDLAGFTTLAERSTPAEMVHILNAYLDDVAALIISNSGYIDKFIGDAVMVLWGAPVKQTDHAKLAFQTAIQFKEICEKFNTKMKIQNPEFEKLTTRVGLHTGRAIVGNIGAKQRHNYTAIGDCVNLASRIEGVGKNYGVELTLTEDVIMAIGAFHTPGLLELDQIIVKGKTEPTRIFTMINPELSEAIENYKMALVFYYKGSWADAIIYFQKALAISASAVMLNRCELALKMGDLSNWQNGAWLYDSK